MKRSKNNNLKIIILGIVLIIVASFASLYILKKNSIKQEKIANNTSESIIEVKENSIKTYKAKLIGAGDALLHSPIYKAAYDSATDSYLFPMLMEH